MNSITEKPMDDYSDIIHLPHYRLKHHRPMPMASRAAQFAPFAALTGYKERVDEEAQRRQGEYDAQGSRLGTRISPDEWEQL